ncbi:hypothetical protein LguiB_000225 [Lonicera macranthoides]
MVKLCLMASQGYLPGLVFNPDQGMCRVFKDYQPLLTSQDSRQDVISSCSRSMRLHHNEGAWKPINRLLDYPQFIGINSTIRKPVLIYVQDPHQNSELFSFGIAKQSTTRKEILKFLASGSSEVERGGLDKSLVSDLLGLQPVTIDMFQEPYAADYVSSYNADSQPSLIYPSSGFYSQKPLLGLTRNSAQGLEFTLHLDGQVSFTGTGTEMKDILSIIPEFYLSKNSSTWGKRSMVVPYFDRVKNREARYRSSLKLERAAVAPLKSTHKIKIAPSQKNKTNRKACKEKDLQRQNYLYACESLLSIIADKNRNGKTAVLALKKSGPELPQLLTQCSASIAGTGLALLFSVVCKVGPGRVPFCASKLMNTGLGLGLVWLSWAVNRLRDTIVNISKNSGKWGLKEKEIMKNVDTSVKEIVFRVAALMAVMVLRLA